MEPSTAFLIKRTRINDPAAMRQLARLVLDGWVPEPEDVMSAKLRLLCAARSADRKAGWLLCRYYLEGTAEFEQDLDAADFWCERTERRLHTDTQYSNVDPALEAESCALYRVGRISQGCPVWRKRPCIGKYGSG